MPPRPNRNTKPKPQSGGGNLHRTHQEAAHEISSLPSDSPIYFWRESSTPYGFLSQWYPSPFTVSGITYHTAEMYMMHQKAITFNDTEIASQILATSDPRKHKTLGSRVKGFTEKEWDRVKQGIVEDATYFKFTKGERESGEELKTWLLGTWERELVEASPYDRIWGIGFVEKEAEGMRERWGENRLGLALMSVRGRIREEERVREDGGE